MGPQDQEWVAPTASTRRIEPTPWVGVLVVVAYAVVFVGLVKASGVGYEQLFSSTSNTLRAAVLPLGVGAVLLVAFLRWARWDGVFHDLRRLSRGRLLASLPVLMTVALVLTLLGVDWAQFTVGHVLAIASAAALVGFTEETVFRGVLLRSLRTGGRSEAAALAWTTLAFGLFHLTNLFLGEWGAPVQVILAGLSGVAFYLARRFTGALVAAMALHASWDLATFLSGEHQMENGFASAAAFFIAAIYPWAAVVLVVLIRRDRHTPAAVTPTESASPSTNAAAG